MKDFTLEGRELLSAPTFGSPDIVDPKESLRTAFVLTTLLVLVVPTIALSSETTLLLLVPIAGLTYFTYLLITDQIIVGFGSAFFVLLTFNANVPVVYSQGIEHANIYLSDLLLVPVAALGIYWYHTSSKQIPKLGRVAIGALGIFAIWSALAALVGNGPSELAALIFSLEQLKFFLVLLTVTLYVLHTDSRCAVYPLLVGIAGHIAFALAQAINGSIFGLSYLGETSNEEIGQILIGPIIYQAGQHTGGFAGSARVLTGLMLLTAPIFAVQLLDSRRDVLVEVVGTTIAGVLVLMSDTDAGYIAFVGIMLVTAVTFRAIHRYRPNVTISRASLVTASAAVLIVILREWHRITTSIGKGVAAVTEVVPLTDQSSSSTSSGGSSSTSSGGSSSTSGTQPSDSSNTAGETSASVSQSGVVDTSTLGIRLRQYDAALDIARRNPLFGIGGSNFNIIAPTYGVPAGMSIHNIFFAYLAATGVPGLLLFLTAVGAVSLLLIRRAIRTSGEQQLLSLGILAGIVGYLALAFWTTLHNSTPVMATFWGVCGIAVGVSATEAEL